VRRDQCAHTPSVNIPERLERWYGFSIFLNADWKLDPSAESLTQWHQFSDVGGSPPLAIIAKCRVDLLVPDRECRDQPGQELGGRHADRLQCHRWIMLEPRQGRRGRSSAASTVSGTHRLGGRSVCVSSRTPDPSAEARVIRALVWPQMIVATVAEKAVTTVLKAPYIIPLTR
jgi:hypothetical protein